MTDPVLFVCSRLGGKVSMELEAMLSGMQRHWEICRFGAMEEMLYEAQVAMKPQAAMMEIHSRMDLEQVSLLRQTHPETYVLLVLPNRMPHIMIHALMLKPYAFAFADQGLDDLRLALLRLVGHFSAQEGLLKVM